MKHLQLLLILSFLFLTITNCGNSEQTITSTCEDIYFEIDITDPVVKQYILDTSIMYVVDSLESEDGTYSFSYPFLITQEDDDVYTTRVCLDHGTYNLSISLIKYFYGEEYQELIKNSKNHLTSIYPESTPCAYGITLAKAEASFDTENNLAEFSILYEDWDSSSFDEDEDGQSNLYEILADTDPLE